MKDEQEIIQGQYKDLVDSMTTLVRNGAEAEILIWMNIFEIIDIDCSAYESDCMGILLNTFVGYGSAASELSQMVRTDNDLRERIKRMYGLSDEVEGLGIYWKELLVGEKKFRLRILESVLRDSRIMLFPYCKKRIVEWTSKTFGDTGIEYTKLMEKQYRKVMKNVLGTERIVSTAIGLSELQNTNE